MQASANVTATCYDSLPHPQLLLLPVAMRGRYLLHYCYCHMLWQLATPSATVTSSCNERPPPILHLLLLSHAMKACHTLSYCYFQLQWMAATSSTTIIATCYDSLPHPQLLLLPVAMNGRHLLHLLLLSHAMKACHLLRYLHFQWLSMRHFIRDCHWHVQLYNGFLTPPLLLLKHSAMKAHDLLRFFHCLIDDLWVH